MANKSPYDGFIGNYVRIYGRVNGTGLLESVDISSGVILSPSLIFKDTHLVKIISLTDRPKFIPYGMVDAMEEIEDGREYMLNVALHSRFATLEALYLKKAELKSKEINDKTLEDEINRLLDLYLREAEILKKYLPDSSIQKLDENFNRLFNVAVKNQT